MMEDRSDGRARVGGPNFWRQPLDLQEVPKIRGHVEVYVDLCKGCGYCIEFCPAGVLATSPKRNRKGYHPPEVLYPEKCTGCGFCQRVCPDFAIVATKEIVEVRA